jgi:hypothetical protein
MYDKDHSSSLNLEELTDYLFGVMSMSLKKINNKEDLNGLIFEKDRLKV